MICLNPFQFNGLNRSNSCCKIQLEKLADGCTVVVCTELEENTGTSITNAVEKIASLIINKFSISPENLIWIEHYPPSKNHGDKEDWDLVTFDWIRFIKESSISNPVWHPMTAENWKSLGLEKGMFND